jgi:nicotinate-nucleotide adenylyltransferase
MSASNRHTPSVTGLFFGSFNPIHNGHLIIAQYMLDYTDLSEVWFIVSPQNPFKTASRLLPESQRLEMVQLAIEGNDQFVASDIELQLGTPSYTIHTLDALQSQYPGRTFGLIMGADNLALFHLWKDHGRIAGRYDIYAYPRMGHFPDITMLQANVKLVKAPLMEISSSLIRDMLTTGKKPDYMLPAKVLKKIQEGAYYLKA